MTNKRAKEAMNAPYTAYAHAEKVIQGRWCQAELTIMTDPLAAYEYARSIIRGRWPAAEPFIMKGPPSISRRYASDILKRRWPEAEPKILTDLWAAYQYAEFVIGGRWPELESLITANHYCKDGDGMVEIFDKSTGWRASPSKPAIAGIYARDVIKGRWPEAEELIMSDEKSCFSYRRDCLRIMK